MNYKHIENSIHHAIDEVREERYQANERLETNIKVFEELDYIQYLLEQALEEVESL